MSSNPTVGRRLTLALAGLIAVAAATLAIAVSGHAESSHGHHEATGAAETHKQLALHDAMRKLWEDHITWTRLAIISLAHELPDLGPTQRRLLKNQGDIGDAIKPYYGRAAGKQLSARLREHIAGAVALLQAAKAGDDDQVKQRSAEWYANGRDIADFLHKANRRNWPRKAMRRMMKRHLDETLDEAVHRLGGDYAADVRDYERIHRHILHMADMLSDGIVKQFPQRFR